MPLENGKSKAIFTHNLKAELAAGKPRAEALAIAYSKQRQHFANGGAVYVAPESPLGGKPDDVAAASPLAYAQHSMEEMQQNPMAYMKYAQQAPGQNFAVKQPAVQFPDDTITAPRPKSHPTPAAGAAGTAPPPHVPHTRVEIGPVEVHGTQVEVGKPQIEHAMTIPGLTIPVGQALAEDHYAHGGAIRAFHHTLADGLQQALHAHVQHFAQGGSPVPTDVEPPPMLRDPNATPGRVTYDEYYASHPNLPRSAAPKMPPLTPAQVEAENPGNQVMADPNVPRPPMSSPELHKHHGAPPSAAAEATPEAPKVFADQDTPPAVTAKPETSPLDALEAERRKALEDARPGIASRIGRALAGAALGAAHREIPDFGKSDRENTADINTEFGKRKAAYLQTPGEEAARAGSIGTSAESAQFRKLVGTIVGDPKLVEGMSAQQLNGAHEFIGAWVAAKRAGDVLAMQNAQNNIKNALMSRKLDIDQQRANAEKSKVGLAQQALQDTNTRTFAQIGSAGRGSPDFTKAKDTILQVAKARPLFDKKEVTTHDIDLAMAELAKAANGGPDQELAKRLASPTVRGQVSKALEHYTGEPGDAGYREIIKKVYKPYLDDLERASHMSMAEHIRQHNNEFGARPGFIDPAMLAASRKEEEEHRKAAEALGPAAGSQAQSAWDAVK